MHFFRTLLVLLSFSLSATAGPIDTSIGVKAPKAVTRRADRLAEYLCSGLTTDREKANAIYNWITHNIRYDVKQISRGELKHDDVKRVLRSRKGVCEGYSYLFRDMCLAVGLQAVTVDGYARDWIFDNGDKLYVPRHEWNAVLIDGQWQLVDVTWGAGGVAQGPGWLRQQMNKISKNPVQSGKMRFKFKYDTSYFLQDPEQFRLVHLPTDPLWQLTDTAMPVAVFEAGTASIKQFNEISRPSQEKDLLGMTADFNEIIRTYEYADRAFAFNPRYYGPLAMRELVDAEVQIRFGDSLNKIDPMPARYRYGKASRALAMSKEYLKQQAEGYNLEARELKQKNHKKSDSAKRYIREIRSDNKRLTAQCEIKERAAKGRLEQIGNKEAALRRLMTDKALQPKKATSTTAPRPEAIAEVMDSVKDRQNRLLSMQADVKAVDDKLKKALTIGKARLDSLADALVLSDSLLIQETIAHIRMQDVYDEDVIAYSNGFRETRFRVADSLQKRYQRGYDSLLHYFNERSKLEYARLNVYKSSLRVLAKYAQPGSGAISSQYNNTLKAFREDAATYASHLGEYRNTVKGYSGVFDALTKLYKRQDRITEYMEKAEENRKTEEEETLAKKEAFNKRENKLQQSAIERSMKRAKKMAGSKEMS